MSHTIVWKRSISGKERGASEKGLRSDLTCWGSRKRKWTGVAREENERKNMGLERGVRNQRQRPHLETALRSLDFTLRIREELVEGFRQGWAMIQLVFKVSLRLLHREQTSVVQQWSTQEAGRVIQLQRDGGWSRAVMDKLCPGSQILLRACLSK